MCDITYAEDLDLNTFPAVRILGVLHTAHLIRLYHPQDGSTSPKFKLLRFEQS